MNKIGRIQAPYLHYFFEVGLHMRLTTCMTTFLLDSIFWDDNRDLCLFYREENP